MGKGCQHLPSHPDDLAWFTARFGKPEYKPPTDLLTLWWGVPVYIWMIGLALIIGILLNVAGGEPMLGSPASKFLRHRSYIQTARKSNIRSINVQS